jgi:hypothetical protein
VHAIARGEHFPFSGCSFEVGNARTFLRIEDDVSSIFTHGNDACREGLVHAPKRCTIVDWARTVRFDADPNVAALARDGVRVRVGDTHAARTYALVEGPEGVDPAELMERLSDARWYDAPIIALAIEPLAPDALPPLERALGGPGAPAGVGECSRHGDELIVEFRPDVTQAALIVRIIDVELARLRCARRARLLTPLPDDVLAAVAAEGLQAPEIASGRILESLLGLEHVE